MRIWQQTKPVILPQNKTYSAMNHDCINYYESSEVMAAISALLVNDLLL